MSRLLVPSFRRGLFLLVSSRRSPPVRRLSSVPRISLQESFRLLQLPDDGHSSPSQVKEAYLRLAKLYHPDSGAATADAGLFARLEEAYRTVLTHQSTGQPAGGREAGAGGREAGAGGWEAEAGGREAGAGGKEAEAGGREAEAEARGAAFQHRHYLSFEGVGSGTPSQRERQYRQIRVDRATEEVLNYRQREHERAAAADGALVERDVRQRSRKIKITQAVERLVEDLIQESMARGDFRNLSGAGKPLSKFQHNPYADPMTHNLNRILIDNGYQPRWVVAQRGIRESAAGIRDRLLEGRARLGDPMTPDELSQWERLRASVEEELVKLNKMVDDYNLIVPMLNMQMVHFSLSRETQRAETGAGQRRLDRQREREEERQRRKEEKRRANAADKTESRKPGLLSWMQNLLR